MVIFKLSNYTFANNHYKHQNISLPLTANSPALLFCLKTEQDLYVNIHCMSNIRVNLPD